MREQLLSVPARTTMQGAWVLGPDETDPTREHAWQARVMSLQQAPPRTFPGILSSLHAPPDTEPFAPWEALPDMPLTLVTQVGVPDQADERALLRQKRNFAYLQRNTALGEEDPEKVRLREDLDRIMKDTTSHILHTRVHLVLWGRADRSLASTVSVLTQSARRLDLEFLPEDILGHQLFLQSLPLGLNLKYPRDRMLRRSRRISSLAAAHLLPLYGDYTGSETPVQLYINRRGEPVTCDLFDATTAAHTIVAGKSRSGKSFLVNHLIQQVLPLGSSVVILDRWASYDTTCEVYKGEYVEIDLDRPVCFNPFAGDLGSGHRTFLMALIDQMASGVSGQDAAGLGQIDKAVCSQALQAFAEWHHQEKPGQEPLLKDFCDLLRHPPFEDDGRAAAIALRIAQYVGKGEYAGFVDGRNALRLSNRLAVFELAKLDKAKDLQSVLLLTLMYRLMQVVTDPGGAPAAQVSHPRRSMGAAQARQRRRLPGGSGAGAGPVPVLRHLHVAAALRLQLGGGAGDQEQQRQLPVPATEPGGDRHRQGAVQPVRAGSAAAGAGAQARDVGRGLPVATGRRRWGDPSGARPVPALAGEPEAAREGGQGEAARRTRRRPDRGGVAVGPPVPGGPAAEHGRLRKGVKGWTGERS